MKIPGARVGGENSCGTREIELAAAATPRGSVEWMIEDFERWDCSTGVARQHGFRWVYCVL